MVVYIDWSKFEKENIVLFGFGAGNKEFLTLHRTLINWVNNKGEHFNDFDEMLDYKLGAGEYTKSY